MANEPFDPEPAVHYQPADPQTQEELGGVLERSFTRESGREPNQEEIHHFAALADEALLQAEAKLSMASDAESAIARAAGALRPIRRSEDLGEVERWTESARRFQREAAELRERAQELGSNRVARAAAAPNGAWRSITWHVATALPRLL